MPTVPSESLAGGKANDGRAKSSAKIGDMMRALLTRHKSAQAAEQLSASECDTCALRNTVIATVATDATYASEASLLARSAHDAAGFPCICLGVERPFAATELHPSGIGRVRQEPVGSASFVLEQHFEDSSMGGWRRTAILKTRLISVLLCRSFDVLSLDADWRFRHRLDALWALRDAGAALVALRDPGLGGHAHSLFNVGQMWLRSTVATRTAVAIAANRTAVAWDQAVLNEELAAAVGTGESGAHCCADAPFPGAPFAFQRGTHDLKRAGRRQRLVERSTHVRPPTYHAIMPPPGSALFPAWDSDHFNELKADRRAGNRCSLTPCGALLPPANTDGHPKVSSSDSRANGLASRPTEVHIGPASLTCPVWSTG